MLSSILRSLPANRTHRLHNTICPYCGCDLNSTNTTKEHVVGRRFVPKGKFNGHWNLIVNACHPCNNGKADLEDDISAITLHPEFGDIHPDYDPATIEDAQRKAMKAISRRTKKPVKDSQEEIKFDLSLGKGVKFGFNFAAPPQIDETRAFELARLQLAGFFCMLTYQKEQERGYWWTGGYHPLMMVRRADYGNAIIVDFAAAVLDWEPRLIGHTAEGYYSVSIRRHPTAECWSWAMEWNGSTRLIGFLGDKDVAKSIVDSLGPLQMHHQDLGNGNYFRFRTDVALEPDNDRLFAFST